MVKKIKGPSGKTSGATRIQGAKQIESAKVGAVDQVKNSERKGTTGKVGPGSRSITPEMRDQIMQMIDEEADRMFGKEAIPAKKKDTVKGAVKMAINASVLEEEKD